ncbi:uncharacterized protein LOC130649658 isoform X2 [Hydractinia symbiolongicarpus]|uniref:uncharacterized protein LOC130649658 isoform X2 n=1 Tax=Hydractinia symbiolongicarpus TaxID=13093 RepID=UPI00254F50D0|nr:uncharacterized protein LOC130649658 isoform X2 [Hydractinia symbiolongicarpus]
MEEREDQTQTVPLNNIEDNATNTLQQSDEEDNELQFKYAMCKYCKGIISRLAKKSAIHCSKVCIETNKVVPNDSADSGTSEGKGSFSGKDLSYYLEVIKEKAAPPSSFFQITENVDGLEPGMKLEAIDINNPVNYCVATVIKIIGHRLRIRYDGFGAESKYDFWCNFQAEELFPIGWCASKGYPLQPPKGIDGTSAEWKAFLTRTLTGALAAPMSLFRKPELRRQLRCHPYLHGNKVEVIHPKRSDLIVPGTITKSLGPYYFLVSSDPLPGLPSYMFYGYADCPNVYPVGWCESRGLELFIPPKDSSQDLKMIRRLDNLVEMTSHGGKRNKLNPLKIGYKVEAMDSNVVRIATVAEVFGRVAMLSFDGTNRKKFIDKCATDVFPVGWCERTEIVLLTPYGPINFQKPPPEVKKKKRHDDISSASFTSFQELTVPISPVITSNHDEGDASVSTTHHSLASPSLVQPPPIPNLSSMSSKETKMESDCHSMEPTAADMDLDVPFSPKSPLNNDKQKHDMEKFVVWLLNNFEYTSSDAHCIVKPDLVDNFVKNTNIKLSPRWFALIYKLFPGVCTVRRSVDGKFVNGIRNLKKSKEKVGDQIFVKNAVSFVQSEGLPVLLHEDKLVIYMGIGDHYILPEDTRQLFETSKAKANSNVLVISCDVSKSDFLASNFSFCFETSPCQPPLQQITTMAEFRASIKLSRNAKLCKGIQIVPKADNTPPNFRHGKMIKNGRLFSSACNMLAYPHKGDVCVFCKNIRCNNRSSIASNSSVASQEHDSMESSDKTKEVHDESGKEDDNLPSPDIKIYFNKTCYPGIYLDPAKVAKISESTHLERPAQTLKSLIERLIEVSLSKEKLLEIIEAGFGVRIFNKAKNKVVKKGLFRYNTRRKVMRFLKRLTKRLNCCEFFLGIDQRDCTANCRKSTQTKNDGAVEKRTVTSPVSMPSRSSVVTSSKPPVLNALPPGNLQVLYQLPVVTTPKPPTPGTPRIVVQPPSDGGNLNPQNRFPHGTQFFLPSSGSNLTYMVMTKENAVSSPRAPVNASSGIFQHHPQTVVTSPPSGVTQMMANVAKTSLVSDIDEPANTSLNQTSQISIVKSSGQACQQILVKKSLPYDSTESHYDQTSDGQNIRQPGHENHGIFSMHNPIVKDPPPYHDAARSYATPYSRVQTMNTYGSEHHTSRPTGEKPQQIHVHKVHHGNARVKYVEFKPAQDGGPLKQQIVDTSHGYATKQTVYYPPHPSNQSNRHLSVHAPGVSPRSPLHSPPALRPPPTVPSRSMALSSPPSLVPSPGFEFVNSNMQANNPTSSVVSPAQVTNMNHPKIVQSGKAFHLVGNQNINLPRIPPTYQIGQHNQVNMIPRNKPTTYQFVRTPTPDSPTPQGRTSGVVTSTAATTTVTVTMTYIPIQTSTKDKFVYVPVNSLQSGPGQPVVLYQQNQQIKDANGKPVLIPQHLIQNLEKNVPSKAQNSSFTTVRIQGTQQGNFPNGASTPTAATTVPLKTLRYQFGSNMSPVVSNAVMPQSPSPASRADSKDTHTFNSAHNESIKREESGRSRVKTENQGEIMSIINNQLRMVPPNVGVQQQVTTPHQTAGVKRNNLGLPLVSKSHAQSMSVDSSPLTSQNQDNENMDARAKKRRGRPPATKLTTKQEHVARSKLQMIQVNPLTPSSSVNPITLANRVLTETFYKKQQQLQNRVNFLHEPLLKLPELPTNPELWSSDDVYRFLSETDCALYANVLKNEEIDGKSFLLMTREALMEFTGLKLGPALKISGHAAYLRARHRMQTMPSNGLQHQSPHIQEKKMDEKRERKSYKIKLNDTVAENNASIVEDMEVCDSTLPEPEKSEPLVSKVLSEDVVGINQEDERAVEKNPINSVPEDMRTVEKNPISLVPEVMTTVEKNLTNSVPEVMRTVEKNAINSVPEGMTAVVKNPTNSVPEVMTTVQKNPTNSVPESMTTVEKNAINLVSTESKKTDPTVMEIKKVERDNVALITNNIKQQESNFHERDKESLNVTQADAHFGHERTCV